MTINAPQNTDKLTLAKESLSQLLHDKRVPSSVRHALKDDYAKLGDMLGRLENEHLHIVAFGRVSVGKSSLLNALIGEKLFSVSVLHGETTQTRQAEWETRETGGVFLIDTPGIDAKRGTLYNLGYMFHIRNNLMIVYMNKLYEIQNPLRR